MRTSIVTTTDGALRQSVRIGPHLLVADEPVEGGGDDAGPAPHEWLLTALGACTSMTLQMYARRKGWPLESVEVSVDGQQDDGAFVFVRHVAVGGPLSDEQRARLLEIANKCPIHKVLTHPIRIETDIAPRI